jgi:hypothetical protein
MDPLEPPLRAHAHTKHTLADGVKKLQQALDRARQFITRTQRIICNGFVPHMNKARCIGRTGGFNDGKKVGTASFAGHSRERSAVKTRDGEGYLRVTKQDIVLGHSPTTGPVGECEGEVLATAFEERGEIGAEWPVKRTVLSIYPRGQPLVQQRDLVNSKCTN